ncbi:hypothetical protein TWF106_004989 [Orbilia oligospora]|uniref:ATP-grasp domain-containing protein n=1 Tax=Orbilia oligospora TaxID=2813651 RepID=A0A7C8Q6U3_ORBOL|nr:hypothetical protein TWF106_004989 [Orbilia oligospora]
MNPTCPSIAKLKKKRRTPTKRPQNILLTNGRFPVTLDLARQLKKCGHTVYVVDCMHYHVAKFSNAVLQSFRAPAPRDDETGYRKAVSEIIRKHNIHLVIPMHEEIIHLAGSNDIEIIKRLLSPPKHIILRLHNKWEFSQWMEKIGLGVPRHYLCESIEDVKNLPNLDKIEYALKPVFGRASQSVYHLKPDKDLPLGKLDMKKKWIAQEWIYGERLEGIKGVFQLAFDFVEELRLETNDTEEEPKPGDTRLVSIECNPRSTSGIHLFAGKTDLALCLTDDNPRTVVAHPKAKRQVFPGMMMWEHSDANVKQWLRHMGRLMGSKDVVFSARDLLPTLMQPFLLTSYYEICREKKLKLPDMFQLDVTWEPGSEELKEVYRLAREDRKGWGYRR